MNQKQTSTAGRRRAIFSTLASGAALAAILATIPATVGAQAGDYPNRPLRMIVPYSAGSASDALARVTAEKLRSILGQPVVVEVKPGANGIIGAEAAAAAPADGYTFVLLNDATAALNVALYPKLSYSPLRDFAPLSMGGDVRMVMIVHPAVPAQTVDQFIALARSKKGQMDYASGGNGSVQQVLMEIFMDSTGTQLTHVPYKGVTPAVNDVASGQVPVVFAGAAGALPLIQSGRVRALAVTSPERFSALPDTPTLAEAGIAGFPSEPWNAFFVPAATPAPIRARLSAALKEALDSPDVREKLSNVIAVRSSTPEDLRKTWERDIDRYGKLVRKVGMKAD